MKPPQFDYADPRSVGEVLDLLRQYGEDAKLLAGGQSLMPLLNLRMARPKLLIDLNRVEGLSYIREEGGLLKIGALTRHREVERSELVAARQPLLTEAVREVGHFPIRNRGTIGGSLVHADPAAELPAVMVALEATLVITGPGGVREVPAAEFFLLYFTTALQPDELLTEVRVPALPDGTGYAFMELSRRNGDFALAGVACTLTLSAQGIVSGCRLALTGVAPAPVRAREAERLLRGQAPTAAAFAEAARSVKASLEPDTDVHGTAEYRRQLAGILTQRALAAALDRASKGGEHG